MHQSIIKRYNQAPPEGSEAAIYIEEHGLKNSLRSYVNDLPYKEQRRYGINVLRDEMRNVKLTTPEREYLNQQLEHIRKTQKELDKGECLDVSLLRNDRVRYPEIEREAQNNARLIEIDRQNRAREFEQFLTKREERNRSMGHDRGFGLG